MITKIKDTINNNRMSVVLSGLLVVMLLLLGIVGTDPTVIKNVFYKMCVGSRPITYCISLIFMVIVLGICVSPLGKLKLGGKSAVPEYSTFSWISMLFAAGSGVGLLFYSSESITHMNSNPFFGDASTLVDGVSMAMFNWTIIPWTLYAVLGLVLAYFHYNKGRQLRLSSALPDDAPKSIKYVIDAIMVLSILGGLCTSLGLGSTQFTTGVNYVFNVELNPLLVMVVLEIVAVLSVMTGINKGIKWLSNSCTVLAIIFLILIWYCGYDYYTSYYTGTYRQLEFLGASLGNFCESFLIYVNPFNSESLDWSANWPVFYQLWFAAWAAFVSTFIVKISKGRSIRAFLLCIILIPSAFAWLWFGIIGYAESPLLEFINFWNSTDITLSLFKVIEKLTISKDILYYLVNSVVLILLGLFFITSSDSGSFVVASLVRPGKIVTPRLKLYWAIIELLIALALFTMGGLVMVQIASVMTGLLVFILTLYGLMWMIYDYYKHSK